MLARKEEQPVENDDEYRVFSSTADNFFQTIAPLFHEPFTLGLRYFSEKLVVGANELGYRDGPQQLMDELTRTEDH